MRLALVLLVLAVAAPAAANPLAEIDRDVDREPRAGLVAEVVQAGPYRYARVTLDEGERWVVSVRRGFDVGDAVSVTPIGVARDFRSARLDRRFEALWFAVVRVE